MAGKIVADTLEHSTAGSIATNYVVNGSAKAWFTYEQAANTLRKSLNTSSITDTATGRFSYNATSAFSDTYSSFVSQGGNIMRESSSTSLGTNTNFSGRTTSVVHHNNMNSNGNAVDYTSCGAGFGDLA
tara:strand:+ start:753 stop:1139 length:387 start_codon:yes stop_codon:yes gene_type:complete